MPRKARASSKNPATTAEVERGGQNKGSVFDFLYHDVRRVGSFLAQFEAAGHLQQVRESKSASEDAKRGFHLSLGGGLGDFASGAIGIERGPAEGAMEVGERVYDPLWANARALLDYLTQRNMVRNDIASAAIGQFVLVSGQLLLLDLAMLKSAWEKPPIQRLMKAGMNHQLKSSGRNREQRRAAEKSALSQGEAQFEVLVALLSMMPHAVQVRLIGNNVNVWCTLEEGAIAGLSSNLILKHGALLGGSWNMLGVLDASPYDPEFKNDDGEGEAEIFARIAETMVGALAARLGPITRTVMGRPPSAYGVTPLLIFRDVSAERE